MLTVACLKEADVSHWQVAIEAVMEKDNED